MRAGTGRLSQRDEGVRCRAKSCGSASEPATAGETKYKTRTRSIPPGRVGIGRFDVAQRFGAPPNAELDGDAAAPCDVEALHDVHRTE